MDKNIKNKEKILDKINKILAKTQNNNSQEECEVAFLKAQEILLKNGLSMSDITTTEEEKDVVQDGFEEIPKTEIKTKGCLAVIIADNFRCKFFVNINTINRKDKHVMTFIGLKSDVEIAKQVYTHVVDTLDNLTINFFLETKERIEKQSSAKYTMKDFKITKDSYTRGFIMGLDAKYKAQVKKNEWALMLVPDKAVEEELKNQNTTTHKLRKSKNRDNEATYKGFQDGYKYFNIDGIIEE